MTVHVIRPVYDLANPASLVLDLSNPRPKDVFNIVEAFETDIRSKPDVGELPVKTGWNDITPTMAINLLRRNRPGANRAVDPPTVFYYARQMARGQWKQTGQAILVDSSGRLTDAQHRLLAVLISGVTIKSYVVTDIEPIPNLFAYIDNTRPRTPATALQTAGFDGVAPIIAKMIRIGEEVKHGVYNPSGATKLERMSPIDILDLVGDYPSAQRAARSAASDWSNVVDYLDPRPKATVAYFGMRVIDAHSEEIADDFFTEVADDRDRPADDPIAALRSLVEKDRKKPKQMKAHYLLAALIKVFNAWVRNESLGRRWMLQVNEDFPSLDAGNAQVEAAE